MNSGLLLKTLRESWFVIVLCAVGVLLLEFIFARVLPSFPKEILSQWFELEFFQRIFKSFLGTDIDLKYGLKVLTAMGWVHPLMLAMFWAQCILLFTAMPALEIDRGTIDPLLGLPVTRWSLYAAPAVVGLFSGVLLSICALVGFVVGNLANPPDERPAIGPSLIVCVNLYAVYIMVGGLSGFVSALTSHRGRAVAIAFAIVAVSFLFNTLEQFWPTARELSFLSVLNYYRPAEVFRDAAWPVANIVTLLGAGMAFWIAGGVIFANRDIRTV